MDQLRRTFLKSAGVAGTMMVAIAAGLLKTGEAFAAAWNTQAFGAKNIADAISASGYTGGVESKDIDIKVPEIAENASVVPLEVICKISGVTAMAVFVDKNPTPLIAEFNFLAGAEPYVMTRIKMGQTSPVRVIVKAAGKTYVASKEVKVTVGGCGG